MKQTNSTPIVGSGDHPREFLGYLELYSLGLLLALLARFQNKLIGTALHSVYHISLTSLHIMEPAGHSTNALKSVAGYIKSSTGSEISLVALNHKEFPFIDGKEAITTANMRSWKNKINIRAGKINLFICGGEDTTQSMFLAIMSLCKGGSAYIKFSLPNEKSISTLHLFIQYFERAQLIYTPMIDSVHIYAESYRGGFRMRDDIYKFCEMAPNATLFNDLYLAGEEYNSTSNIVMAVFEVKMNTMISHYNNILGK